MSRLDYDAYEAMKAQGHTPDYWRGFRSASRELNTVISELGHKVEGLRAALVYGVMLALLIGIGIGVAVA